MELCPDDRGRWQADWLAGGDFEDLDLMLHNGWQQSAADQTGIQSAVELSFHSPRSGRSCLHYRHGRSVPPAIRLESGPFMITAPVPVQPTRWCEFMAG